MKRLFVAFAVLAAMPAAGFANPLFTVRDVAVDVTAASAASARDQALREGQDRAWALLLSRLTDADPRFLPLDDGEADMSGVISNLGIANERTSDVRYVADLTVGFDEQAVRDLLIARNVAFVQSMAPAALLLPVKEIGDAPVLWQGVNLWADAWRRQAEKMVLQPLIVPEGDAVDQAILSAEAAATHNEEGLTSLSNRYGTESAIVAVARGGFDDRLGVARVDIAVTRIGERVTQGAFIETVYGEVEEAPAALYARAAGLVARQLAAAWKRENLISVDEGGSFLLTIPVDGLDAWLETRRILQAVPMLTSRRLVRLTRTEAELDIVYVGGLRQVERFLGDAGLALAPMEDSAPDLAIGSAFPAPQGGVGAEAAPAFRLLPADGSE
ncbi:MAG: DUF2066 domain-containing protein [Alphaproteobacteria bacterium]|nr:DUF2066 domain-containing protein [Alphaproteobacteria bacterium]